MVAHRLTLLSVMDSICQQNKSMCRENLNYTCLQFNQCGRKFFSLLFLIINHYSLFRISLEK
jgi:hypothetical protein